MCRRAQRAVRRRYVRHDQSGGFSDAVVETAPVRPSRDGGGDVRAVALVVRDVRHVIVGGQTSVGDELVGRRQVTVGPVGARVPQTHDLTFPSQARVPEGSSRRCVVVARLHDEIGVSVVQYRTVDGSDGLRHSQPREPRRGDDEVLGADAHPKLVSTDGPRPHRGPSRRIIISDVSDHLLGEGLVSRFRLEHERGESHLEHVHPSLHRHVSKDGHLILGLELSHQTRERNVSYRAHHRIASHHHESVSGHANTHGSPRDGNCV